MLNEGIQAAYAGHLINANPYTDNHRRFLWFLGFVYASGWICGNCTSAEASSDQLFLDWTASWNGRLAPKLLTEQQLKNVWCQGFDVGVASTDDYPNVPNWHEIVLATK